MNHAGNPSKFKIAWPHCRLIPPDALLDHVDYLIGVGERDIAREMMCSVVCIIAAPTSTSADVQSCQQFARHPGNDWCVTLMLGGRTLAP